MLVRLIVFAVIAIQLNCAVPAAKVKKQDHEESLAEQLKELNKDGVAVVKSKESHVQKVNGHGKESHKEKQTLSNAKTGQVVANVEKSGADEDEKIPEEKLKVDIPAASVHESETFHEISPESMARYIFDSSDYDGVQHELNKLVGEHKVSQTAADEFMKEVNVILEKMHEDAFLQLQQELEASHEADEGLLKKLYLDANKLNENAKVLSDVQDVSRKLFHKFITQGDKYAEKLLSKFATVIQEAKEAGHLDEGVQKNVLSAMLHGITKEEREHVT